MFLLTCPVRGYDWGSTSLIPRFLDEPQDGSTQAELWVGAHPADPARLPDGRQLDDYIRAHPETVMGAEVEPVFGDRLPYLVKALAAARPLSLQVHPTTERARVGFDLEEQAGIPVGAPDRSYQDLFHKPEMILAITRFEGMAGFRDVEKSARILRLLEHTWADGVAEQLESGPPFQTLQGVVSDVLAMTGDSLGGLVAEIADAARRAEERGHRTSRTTGRRYLDRTSVERESTRLFAQTAALADRYPTDPGVLVTLLLNHVVLAPGEAMFLDAGVVHAYSSGFGIEIMAASDNVVRAGLTSKHVDVPELLQIANFTPMPPPLWEPVVSGTDVLLYEPPVTEFALRVIKAPSTRLPVHGPRIVLVLDGELEVVSVGGRERLARGQALFVEDGDGPIALEGSGDAAVACVPIA